MRKNIFILLALLILTSCTQSDTLKSPWEYGKRSTTQTTTETTTTQDTYQSPTQTSNIPVRSAAPVKVAILLPLSGQHAQLSQTLLNSAQLALFDIPTEGFELLPKDTHGTPDGAARAATEALNEGAQLILGPVFASSVNAVKPVANRASVNVIAFSTDWSLAGGNAFIMGFLPFDQIERITDYAASRGINTLGIFGPNNAYGKAVANAASRTSSTVTRTQLHAENGADIAIQAANFASTPNMQGVVIASGGSIANKAVTTLKNNGLTSVQYLGTGLLDTPDLAPYSALQGTWFAAPSPDLRKSFENKFTNTYGYQPPRIATLAYDATALASVLATKGLQSRGRPAYSVTDLKNPAGFYGVDGPFRFRQNNTAERGLAVLEVTPNGLRIIDDAPKSFTQ